MRGGSRPQQRRAAGRDRWSRHRSQRALWLSGWIALSSHGAAISAALENALGPEPPALNSASPGARAVKVCDLQKRGDPQGGGPRGRAGVMAL